MVMEPELSDLLRKAAESDDYLIYRTERRLQSASTDDRALGPSPCSDLEVGRG